MMLIKFLLLLLFDFGICNNITILHLGEDVEIDINEVIERAVKYANEIGIMTHLISYRFKSNEDVKTVFENITSEVIPDIILDTTRNQEHAIVAEKIALNYCLPTISTSWIERPAEENVLLLKQDTLKNYFFKLKTPTSRYNELIEDFVYLQGMTNVAVIYLPEFEACKNLRYNFSSRGIPCVFMKYVREKRSLTISAIKKMYFQNIFLLGNLDFQRDDFESNQVVYLILDRNTTLSEINRADINLVPHFNTKDKIIQLSRQYIHINWAFYFDLTLIAIESARANGRPQYEDSYCENAQYPNRKDLNFKIIQQDNQICSKFNTDNYMDGYMELKIMIQSDKVLGSCLIPYSRRTLNLTYEESFKSIKSTSHYKVLARIKPPFVYYDESTRKAFGYHIDLLDLMASILNFTYELTVIETHQSDLYPERVYNRDRKMGDGFLSEMLKRNVDIGLGPVYATVAYEELDFSIPYYKSIGIKFIMKRSKDDSIFTFITVLETIVWVCILFAFFISSFLLWSAERFSPYSYRNDKERYKDVEEVRDFTVKECLWFCLTSLTPQGGGIIPQHFSGRLVVVTWWLFGFIILASYTANLSAFLTLSKMKNPIESFTDLYRQFHMKYAPLNRSDEENYFMNMAKAEVEAQKMIQMIEYPLPNKYSRMQQIILNSTYPNTVDEALERVYASVSATEGFAFLVDSMDAKYLLMTRCNLIDIDEEVGKRPLAIVMPKFTLLKHNINKALTIIMEKRLDVELEKKWWDDNPYKATNCVELEDESEGIGIYNIGGVFFIIFIGIGIASLTIAFDYFRYVRRQRCRVTMVTPLSNENRLEETTRSDGIEIPRRNEEVENLSKLQHRNVTRY